MGSDDGMVLEDVEVIPLGLVKRRLGGRDRLIVPAGQSVKATLARLGVDPRSTMVRVNGRQVAREYVLRAGDKVTLLHLIMGG
jgi:sulfur carrier protein ThiS